MLVDKSYIVAGKATCILLTSFFSLLVGTTEGQIYSPSLSDNAIVIEAELATILDNTYSNPSKGWIPNGISSPAAPVGASGGTYLVQTEQIASDNDAPANSLTYYIDFAKPGNYRLYTRAAFSTQDLDDDLDEVGSNDSYFFDGGLLLDNEYTRINRLGEGWVNNGGVESSDDLVDNSWRWFGNDTSSTDGEIIINVQGEGVIPFTIGSREDGLLLDKIVLLHEDDTSILSDSFFDGLSLTNSIPATGTTPKVTINRDTGTISLNTGLNQDLLGYSILSPAGSLDQSNWNPISGRLDATNNGGNGSVDSDDAWIVLSDPSKKTDLSEAELFGGDGGTLAANTTINLGGSATWTSSHIEDVTVELLTLGGGILPVEVEFTGNGGQAYELGDFNTDSQIDLTDYSILVASLQSDQSSLSTVDAYRLGDLNEDLKINFFDVTAFAQLFEAANGVTIQTAIANAEAVPEPTSLWSFAVACIAMLYCRRANRNKHLAHVMCDQEHHKPFISSWVLACTRSGASLFVVLVALPASAVVIRPNPSDNVILFEAETGTVDNSSNDGSLGWVLNGVTDPLPPFGTSGGSYLVNTENLFIEQSDPPISDPTTNTITFDIDFQKTGNYQIFFRAAFTTEDFESTSDLPTGNDSFYWSPNPVPASGIAGNLEWARINRLGQAWIENGGIQSADDLVDDEWRWFSQESGSGSDGNNNPLIISTAGESNFLIGGREDGLMFDRFALVHEDETEVITSQYLDSLFNTPAGPNPRLTLSVSTDTGSTMIFNEAGDPVTINYYEILSDAGSLNSAGWESLDSQNYDAVDGVDVGSVPGDGLGEGWDAGGDADTNDLTEVFFTSSSTIADESAISLGFAFTAGSTQDLKFRYDFGSGFGDLREGVVQYTTGLHGDYNNDGVVDAADYTVWRDSAGQSGVGLNADGNNNGVIDQGDYQIWVANFGQTSIGEASSQAASVPEPKSAITMMLVLFITTLLAPRNLLRTRGISFAATCLVALITVSSASADVTNDRDYQFGDDVAEGASAGIQIGSGNGFSQTFDSAGTPGAGDLDDLRIGGTPTYISVDGLSGRPGATSGDVGASFNGTDSVLYTPISFNAPSQTWDFPLFYPGGFPHNYEGIFGRGMQLWVKPDQVALTDGNRQEIVSDTPENGIYITGDGNWGIQYTRVPLAGDTGVSVSGTLDPNGWAHVMQVAGISDPTSGKSRRGGAIYVNGSALAVSTGSYNEQNLPIPPLSVGASVELDLLGNLSFSSNHFEGVLDDLEIFLWGNNTSLGGQDYGDFRIAEDNDWIVQEFSRLATVAGVTSIPEGDINFDGVVSGDGTGPASTDDVTALLENWRYERLVSGERIGDWTSRLNGDLNFDGVTDLRDAFIVHEGLITAGSPGLSVSTFTRLTAVPEPSTIISILIGNFCLVGSRRDQA